MFGEKKCPSHIFCAAEAVVAVSIVSCKHHEVMRETK